MQDNKTTIMSIESRRRLPFSSDQRYPNARTRLSKVKTNRIAPVTTVNGLSTSRTLSYLRHGSTVRQRGPTTRGPTTRPPTRDARESGATDYQQDHYIAPRRGRRVIDCECYVDDKQQHNHELREGRLYPELHPPTLGTCQFLPFSGGQRCTLSQPL